LWIHAEEDLERAKALLTEYQGNSADAKYQASRTAAEEVKEKKRQEQAAYERRVKQRRHLFRPLTGYRFGPVTFLLILASASVFVLSNFGRDSQKIMDLFIAPYTEGEMSVSWFPGLHEIREGQVWRLFTPMLIHFSIIHIFFNMMWLADLGSMVEGRQSSWLLAILVFAIAAGSNLAQYYWGGPAFGGMSGVVYGLIGYIWMRGKYDPGSGLYLQPTTVTMSMIWFFACLFNMVPGVANMAHAAGLLMGLAWGFLSSLRHR
jgi:GlpG protein